MNNYKLSISVNRSTKELVGYWKPDNSDFGIIVTAFAVDDLHKKFEKAIIEYDTQYRKEIIKKIGKKLCESDEPFGGSLS